MQCIHNLNINIKNLTQNKTRQLQTRKLEPNLIKLCDSVSVGMSSSVSLENRLFYTNCKKYQQISTDNIRDI